MGEGKREKDDVVSFKRSTRERHERERERLEKVVKVVSLSKGVVVWHIKDLVHPSIQTLI